MGYQFKSKKFNTKELHSVIKKACKAARRLLEKDDILVRIQPIDFKPLIGGMLHNDIARAIDSATICIFEISERNLNVYFELGYAKAARKKVITIINQKCIRRIPSDLRGHHFIPYENGIAETKQELSRCIVEGIKRLYEELPSLIFWGSTIYEMVNVFLGRTENESFSSADIEAMNKIRMFSQSPEKLNLKLKNKVEQNDLKSNLIAIGGPKRNNIAKFILKEFENSCNYFFINTKDEDDKTKYRDLIQEKNASKLHDVFFIANKTNRQIFSSEMDSLKSPDPGERASQRRSGRSYGLVYKIHNPYIKNAKWFLFAGINRETTLAMVEAFVSRGFLLKLKTKIRRIDTGANLEILVCTNIVKGRDLGISILDLAELHLNIRTD